MELQSERYKILAVVDQPVDPPSVLGKKHQMISSLVGSYHHILSAFYTVGVVRGW